MPIGVVVVPGWYVFPASPFVLPVLPGGMVATNGLFAMIVAGWVAFTGPGPL